MRNLYFLLALTLLSFGLQAQIVINEIIPPNTIEIKNNGGSTVNIASYTLCRFPSYNQLSNITQVCGGDLMIEAGTTIAVTINYTLSAGDGELALYLMNGSFDSPSNIVDYVEWGSTGHVRSSVAQAAGIWSAGDFVPAWTGCASLEYDGGGDSSSDWVTQDVPSSPCMANTLDGCGGSNCSIAGAGLTGVSCNNNGTPSDPADDYVSFNMNPTGIDLGSTYTVSVSSGSITPTSANYGSPTGFQLQSGSAGSGNVTVTITDGNDSGCTFNVVVTDPGSCSNMCAITDVGLSGIFCNDADSPSDDTDDFIMFNLDPEGLNLGATYTVSVSSGSVTPSSAPFGSLTVFEMSNGTAGGGNITVTVTDANDPGCTAQVVVTDPGTCSDACGLEETGLDDILCDNNGTEADDSDDFITFSLDPFGVNTGATYTVSVSSGSVNPTSGTYGGAEFFSLNPGSAGDGNVTVTVTDGNDIACSITAVITDPGACSSSCNLNSAGLGSVVCNDNSTNTDPTDDYISFNLNPTGVNLGASYQVSVSSGTITPETGSYGAPLAFSLNNGSAGGGNVVVTITDASNPDCDLMVTITDPGSCSALCGLTSGGLASVVCNDAGTGSDPADDFLTFSLNPEGGNLGDGYSIAVSFGTISPDTGVYGAAMSFALGNGSAGGGDILLTIIDNTDPACTLEVFVADPGSCSGACGIAAAGLSMVTCDPNGSQDDESDDFISFVLDPSGAGLGAGYVLSVSVGTVSPDTGVYGTAGTFMLNAGSAGAGDVILTITDADDPACSLDVTISDPGSCLCEVLNGTLITSDPTIICVDDGFQDSIEVTVDPLGVGENSAWILTDTAGVITGLPADNGDPQVFNFEGEGAGICVIMSIVWSGSLEGLAIGQNIDTLSGCYALSNGLTVTKQSGADCISEVFNPDLDALITIYPVPVTGYMHIESREVSITGVRILDLLGRGVADYHGNTESIDVRQLTDGLYYVVFETNRGSSLRKVVIKR